MNKSELIKELNKHLYCRLRRSKIEGIGIVAIKDIPAGINPFLSHSMFDEFEKFTPGELDDLDPGVKEYVLDICASDEKYIYMPKMGMNGINISFFLNHSNDANIETADGGVTFRTKRSITEGEELTSDYNTYGGYKLKFLS